MHWAQEFFHKGFRDGSLFATPSVFLPQSNTSIDSKFSCQTFGDESLGLLCDS